MNVALQIAFLTTFVLVLASAVLVTRRLVLPSGNVSIRVNDADRLIVPAGNKLLWTLAEQGIILPAACGGRGSCGQCRVIVSQGGGEPRLTEREQLTPDELRRDWRLACMVTVRDDLSINVAEDVLAARRWSCKVQSRRLVSAFQLELVLEIENGDEFQFEAGGYVLLEAPAGETRFADYVIDDEYRSIWEQNKLFRHVAPRDVAIQRAYSMSNPPHDKGIASFVIRIALPPAHAPAGTPAGLVSSYAFGLGVGDSVTISGPFGTFRATENDNDMVFVGGGAGIAPLRSIILDQLLYKRTERRITFYYGVRTSGDLCFVEEFDELVRRFENFSWQVALSEPQPDDQWDGPTGFIHTLLDRQFLRDHPAPEDVEYYICGPPVMASAVIGLLEDAGVDRDHIFFDDFGN